MEALQAIAHPDRRAILRLVWDSELASSEIAANFEATWQAVSYNLRVLRETGLVAERRDGTRRLYRAARDELAPLEGVLRRMWEQDLERLDRVIAEDKAGGPRS